MNPGETIPPFRFTPRAEAMREFAAALRDTNPIHLDRETARRAGFAGRVNQGPANLAYIMNALALAFPGHRIATLTSRYLSAVTEDVDVEAGGVVTDVSDDGIECDIWLRRADGANVISGVARLVPR